jgi:anti-sigma factor RsiW
VNLQSCDDYQELASALADDLLETAEISDLQGHLRECPECRRFLSGIYRVSDFIRAEEVRHPLPVPPPHFAADLARALGREANRGQTVSATFPSGRFSPFWGRFSGLAAAAGLLLAAGWALQQFSGSGVTPVAVSEKAVIVESEEASMASYVREYALQAMDATYLGFPEGIELARFEAAGTDFE